ncbi:MAG TPA: 50S ribosomal protein L11 methyltransferase [Gallionellaceae bacterium]
MSWLTLTVEADASVADSLSEALLELGALSVDVHDAEAGTTSEQPVFGEPDQPPPSLWAHNLITALFPEDAPVEELLRRAAEAAGLKELPRHRIEALQDNDWVRLTQAQFDPIRISERLWIVPTWHTPTDPAAINIVLDPGLAFGTGSHPTTQLCLRWLDANLERGERVLDYGCGSGILAIAAMKLGAASVVGVDLDPQAIQASRDNAVANRVVAHFYLPDEAPSFQADVVVANILTNPLRLLAPLLAGCTRAGGQIVLSGILSAQADEIRQVYGQWFDFNPPIVEDGWVCLSGTKQR